MKSTTSYESPTCAAGSKPSAVEPHSCVQRRSAGRFAMSTASGDWSRKTAPPELAPGFCWLQAVLPDDGRRGWRGEELDERPRRIGLLRARMDTGGEHGHPLQLARQRADEVDAGEMHQLADLLEADLGVAAGDQGADEHAGWRLPELLLDLIRDAELLEHAQHVEPAWAGRIADRFRGQQGFLQCVG